MEVKRPELDYLPTMPSVVHRAASEFGTRAFIVTDGAALTFAELESRSRALAKALLASGVGKSTRVAFHLPNGTEWVTAWAAITRVGGLAIPLSTLAAPSELAAALRHTDAHVLIAPTEMFGRDHEEYLERALPELTRSHGPDLRLPLAPYLRTILMWGTPTRAWGCSLDRATTDAERRIDDVVIRAVEREVVPSDELMVVSTSGSTSEPKAVVHTHGAVFRKTSVPSVIVAPPGGCVFVGHAFFWIGGILNLGAAMHTGATIVCQERPHTESALRLIAAHRATGVMTWPTTTQRLRSHPLLAELDTSSAPQLTAPPSDPRQFHSSLGMTETIGPHSEGPRHDAPPEERTVPLPAHLWGSFGAPLEFVEHRIVDPATGDALDAGVEGEICVRGYSLMARMYKRERHEVFDRDGWYHTGDRGFMRDGYLFFTGRATEMIKTHGANVSPREVELALEGLPAVAQAYVFGLADPERGERVVAVVVPADPARFELEAVLEELRESVAAYKVPRQCVVLRDDEVPWLASGKPDRVAIHRLLAENLDPSSHDPRGGDVAHPIPA